MTQADDVDNITLGTGGSAVTVYAEHVEKIFSKLLIDIQPAQSTANWDAGPLNTMIVDLLRIKTRFSIRGTIASADVSNLEAWFEGGGVFNMTWDGTDYNINMDKLTITKGSKFGEQDERTVAFTCVVGVDI